MQKFVKVRSTAPQVNSIEIDEYHVYVNKGITEIHEPGTDEMMSGFDGFEIDEQTIYEKDEYIAVISQENSELGETVNTILTEIIPGLM